MIAFGLLIRYRGGSVSDHSGMIAGQVVLGVAGGLFPYQAQVLIQAVSAHEREFFSSNDAAQSRERPQTDRYTVFR